jgi:branched-subunit amino acid ABC-type transport system permease component
MSRVSRIVSFISLFFTALALCPYVAHLMAFPNKMEMTKEEYFIAQQVYSGWSYSSILILLSFVSTIVLSILAKDHDRVLRFSLGSVFCIGMSLMVFFVFTFPANQFTRNWTFLTQSWEDLRIQWEYSHAFNAVLYIAAEALLIMSVLSWPQKDSYKVSLT